nr:hypothetical protein [Tanacetum cinerariifolium]
MIELRGTFQAWLQQQKDQVVNLDSYSPKPLQCQNILTYYDDDDDEESSTPLRDIIISKLPSCIAITPVLSTKETKDSLIMRDEHLDTIPEKESDKFKEPCPKPNFLKSILPGIDEADCDPEEEIRLIEKLLYDNLSPRLPKEINFENSDAVIKSFSPSPIPVEDSDPFMKEIDLFLTSNRSIPPDIFDFSNVVRIFPPLFTYSVTSSILLSSKSEDTIFDPGISDYHFSSFMSGVSHWSGTFMKFNVYPNHLNESPMEILSSTFSLMDQ